MLDSLRILYIDPALLIPPIDFDNYGPRMFIENLMKIDVILAANTLGDELTDGFMLYIEYLQQVSDIHPAVALDLCNLPELYDPSLIVWRSVVRGFIAPSVYVGKHSQTLESGKPVRIVYPPVSHGATSQDYHNNACKANLPSWPRKVSGKFRIGCIGRLTFERSPGLCILLMADIIRIQGRDFVHRSLEFLVVGGGELLADLIRLAEELEIADLITFTGFVSNIHEVLVTLDLAVNTMVRGENFGILNAECVMSCTPVISFNRSATQESLSGAVSSSLLVQDITLSSLVERLLEILHGNIEISADMLRYTTASHFLCQ